MYSHQNLELLIQVSKIHMNTGQNLEQLIQVSKIHMNTGQNLEQLIQVSNIHMNTHTHTHTPEFRTTDKGVQYTHVHTPKLRTTYKGVKYAHVKGKVIPAQACGTKVTINVLYFLSLKKNGAGTEYREKSGPSFVQFHSKQCIINVVNKHPARTSNLTLHQTNKLNSAKWNPSEEVDGSSVSQEIPSCL